MKAEEVFKEKVGDQTIGLGRDDAIVLTYYNSLELWMVLEDKVTLTAEVSREPISPGVLNSNR